MQNLYLRSYLPFPYPNSQQRYNPWQSYYNRIPVNPYRRTQGWATQLLVKPQPPPLRRQQVQYQPQQQQLEQYQQQQLEQYQEPQQQQQYFAQHPPPPVPVSQSYTKENLQSREQLGQPTPTIQFNPVNTQPVQTPTLTSQFTGSQTPTQIQHTCSQCNGDCNNYLCYGCGGCPEPPPEKQTYFYPYQRQDAGLS